jgi:hypothetical protein
MDLSFFKKKKKKWYSIGAFFILSEMEGELVLKAVMVNKVYGFALPFVILLYFGGYPPCDLIYYPIFYTIMI